MTRLSIDAELDRLLAESQEGTRYRDCALVLRRLTLARPVREGAELVDEAGRLWKAGEVGADGVQPVANVSVGASTKAPAGTWLRCGDDVVELRAEVIASVGGVWDTLRNDWRLDEEGRRVPAAVPVVVDLMESQIEAARWAAERVAAFRAQRPHPQSTCQLFSDRRAGKTFVAVLIVLLLAFDSPKVGRMPLVAWLVSTMHGSRDELDREIKGILPGSGKSYADGGLYIYRELPKHEYRLLNGAVLQHKTIDDIEASLRAGTVDVAILNEAASMPFSAYRNVLRGTQDHTGFVVLTNNTPKRTRGNWVTRLADGAARDVREGRDPAVAVFRPDPKKNAAVSQAAKGPIDQALRYCLDEGETLDEGVILEADAKCYSPPFDLDQHVKGGALWGLVDVTAEVLQRLWGRPYQFLVGQDYQQQCAAVAFRIMARDARPESWKAFTLVAAHAWFLGGGGDEDDLLDAMEADGFTAATCFVVGDSSGAWQKGDHGYGPVSFAALRSRGWHVTGPTKPRTKTAKYGKNPDVEQTVGRLRTLIRDGRFLVAASESTKALQKALHKCDAIVDRYGNLRPKGIHGHLTDCCRYAHHWLATNVGAVAAQVPAYVRAGR